MINYNSSNIFFKGKVIFDSIQSTSWHFRCISCFQRHWIDKQVYCDDQSSMLHVLIRQFNFGHNNMTDLKYDNS